MSDFEFISYDDLFYFYGISQEEVDMIGSSFIKEKTDNGVWLYINSDANENGLPDFYDSYLGIDVILKPSQGVVFG